MDDARGLWGRKDGDISASLSWKKVLLGQTSYLTFPIGNIHEATVIRDIDMSIDTANTKATNSANDPFEPVRELSPYFCMECTPLVVLRKEKVNMETFRKS